MANVDIRAIVTDKIISGLENGIIPWKRPWEANGMALSHSNGKYYRGLNQIILTLVADLNGWVNRWMTFKQIASKGWKVKKGEHGTPISYFKWIEDEDEDVKFPLLRYYTVFSLSQLEEMPEFVQAERDLEPLVNAESIVASAPIPKINHGGSKASYSPKDDVINMPLRKDFHTSEGYYATLFHEMGHSTGHESRLARKGIVEFDKFGSAQYGLEELVAEFTSAFLCAECGIDQPIMENATAYIQSWLAVLKNDRQMLLTAASQAQKASDYILGTKFGKEEDNGN